MRVWTEQDVVEPNEKIFEMLKNKMAMFITKQCCTIKHTCVRTKTGLEGSNKDQRGLVGLQVQQAGEWGGIRCLLPSQNVQVVVGWLVWG